MQTPGKYNEYDGVWKNVPLLSAINIDISYQSAFVR